MTGWAIAAQAQIAPPLVESRTLRCRRGLDVRHLQREVIIMSAGVVEDVAGAPWMTTMEAAAYS